MEISNIRELEKEELMLVNGGKLSPEQLAGLFDYINDFIDYYTSPPLKQ